MTVHMHVDCVSDSLRGRVDTNLVHCSKSSIAPQLVHLASTVVQCFKW